MADSPAWSTVAVAVVAAVPPTLVAAAGLLSSYRNSKKLGEVHVLVNSNLAGVKVDLANSQQQILDLQKLVQKLLKQKANGTK